MNDWITDRPPTEDEVADDERCVVHLIDNHGINNGMSMVRGKFVREEWSSFDRWFKIPAEPPEPEMPDEIEIDVGWIPSIPTSTKSVSYVRKDLVEKKTSLGRLYVDGSYKLCCVTCGHVFFHGPFKYCPVCGRRIER
jgi:rubrerythrin